MDPFADLVARMDATLQGRLGTPCQYQDSQGGTFDTRVVISKNVEVMSAYDTQMPARRNLASLIKAEIPSPKRGHTITLAGGEVYVVDQLDTDDGHMIRVLLQ